MNRRKFLRVIGGTSVVTAMAPNYAFSDTKFSQDGILIEAASFASRGGWVLDTQFFQQMGGAFLLAHGIGNPVQNAITEIDNSSAGGDYYIHVRTRDWCPGNWDAPGQFKVIINGKPLATTFGTEAGWAWQKGGKVTLNKSTIKRRKENIIELQDLTGFDGRVDAIYLSKEENPVLPNDPKDLFGWKDQLTGRSKLKVEEKSYDVVIVGGGITGCGAALAAKAQGLNVALIQDRPLFGGNASEEVRVHTLGIKGKSAHIIDKIDTEHWPNGHAHARIDQVKREKTMKESGVDLFPSHLAIGLEKNSQSIASIEARHSDTGIITRFKAPQFIDCTGDGWLGFWAGAEFRYGRESHKEFGEQWEKHGDLWSPEKADNKVMGTSVLWNSQKGTKPSNFPKVPWAMPVVGKSSNIKGEWFWEYSNDDLNQIDDAELIRDHMFRAIFGNFYNAKRSPKNALVELKWVAFIGGRRESRRIVGDHIYSMQDAAQKRTFEDTVVEEKRELDTHYQRKETGDSQDYLSKALFYKQHGLYYIPFRSLYSKDIPNLMIAGRCFSCTHIGLTGPRVMNTCGQMGIATGYAAALCKKYSTNPREVGKKHIKELRKIIGYDS
ncbi:MAG: FAD-dependent oxidoreductase [Lentisphaerales bacterium]|nr:FAD-dependent oxidoreductase [Lentisphaerales bacterium]